MSELTPTRHRPRCGRDRGFTLIELLIVISLMGLVVTVLSSAIIVILRTAPNTELRIDDARSTRGLATWLSHDVASTPPFEPPLGGRGGFNLASDANACFNPPGTAPAGTTLVELTWVQLNRTFAATYRVESVDSGNTAIRRYACSRTDSGPWSAPVRSNLTSGLASSGPNVVNLVKDPVTGAVTIVELRLTGRSGDSVLLDVSSRNPSEFFP